MQLSPFQAFQNNCPDSVFVCKVIRKHFFKDRIYILHQTNNLLTMTFGANTSEPKYKMTIPNNDLFHWIAKDNHLIGFKFPYQGKMKDFYGQEQDLLKLKARLGQLLIYSQLTAHYIYIKTLESGSFGQVTINECKFTKKRFAVKHIQLNGRKDQRVQIENEIKILRSLKGPLVLQIYEVYRTDLYYQIVTEYIEGDNLKQILNNKEIVIQKDQILNIMRQLLEALQSIHRLNIIHRDIKPANIMYHKQKLKLIDFGLACFDGRQMVENPNCGTEGYVAPEVLNVHQTKLNYDFKVDVYSVGCVLNKLLTGEKFVYNMKQSWNKPIKGENEQLLEIAKIFTKQNSLDRPSSSQALELINQIRENESFDVKQWYKNHFSISNSNTSYQTASTARYTSNPRSQKSILSFNNGFNTMRGHPSNLKKLN